MAENLFKNVYLESSRIFLRNFTYNDKKDFFDISRDPKIYETLPEDHMYSLEEISEIIDWFIYQYDQNKIGNIPKFTLGIFLKNTNELIGDIGIGYYSLDNTKMEIFFFINSKYWNKGYVSEAVKIFLNYIKENKLVTSLIGIVVPNNIASSKILLNNGFKKIIHEYHDKRDMYELIF